MNKKQIAITLGIVCFILMIGIFIQIRTVEKANKIVSQSFTDNDLRDQVLKWKEKYDATYDSLEQAEKKLENVRKTSTENSQGSSENESNLKKNNVLLGLTDVTGDGVVITLKDNNNVTSESIGITDDISLYLVHEDDIRSLVNELENAGAEAISVNDQRIVSTTSITCEGNVININGEKIGSPFTIKAIGNSLYMYSALVRAGGYVEKLNTTGIETKVRETTNISISKYTGVISSKYIKYSK